MARTPIIQGGKLVPGALKGVDTDKLSATQKHDLSNTLARHERGEVLKADDANALLAAHKAQPRQRRPVTMQDAIDKMESAINVARALR